MKNIVILLVSALLLASCGAPTSLYYWGGTQNGTTTYENLAYKDYKVQTPKVICALVCAYEDMVTKQGGIRQVPPPGICAEYGYLLLQPATAEMFAENATAKQKKIFDSSDYGVLFSERGKLMLQKELEYYPESKKFIEPLLKRLTQ